MVMQEIRHSKSLKIYQTHTGRILDSSEFLEDIRSRVRRFVDQYKLFGPRDTLLLGLSGGKDSFVLLDVLAGFHPSSRLVGVSIIEGIPGYNKHEDILRMRRLAREYGIDVITTSFREYVGHSLYEIMKNAWQRGLRVSACTFCGILRRRILNLYARIYGASYVVTGHNLDDTAQTMIINLLRGDFDGLLKAHPLARPPSSKMVQRVKPLRMIYEWETSLYAYIRGFPFQETECMYISISPTLRAKVRRAMNKAEEREPGVLLRLVEWIDRILTPYVSPSNADERDFLPLCPRCGEPMNTGRSMCKLCELLEKSGIHPIYHRFQRD